MNNTFLWIGTASVLAIGTSLWTLAEITGDVKPNIESIISSHNDVSSWWIESWVILGALFIGSWLASLPSRQAKDREFAERVKRRLLEELWKTNKN